jgi:hypothetical protein
LSEELLQRLESLLREQGYELVGIFERDKLDLSKLEKCEGTRGTGGCFCSVGLDIVLHEVDVSDIAIVVFASSVAVADPLETGERCEGSIELELYVETDTLHITIDKFTSNVCVVYL